MADSTSRFSQRTMGTILARRPDPLGVLSTTAQVVVHARSVSIDRRRIETVAQVLALQQVPVPLWNYEYHFFDGTERSVAYILLLDTLNFSFWGEPRWKIKGQTDELDGYWALALALKRAAQVEPRTLDADYLAEISPGELGRILRGENEIPLLVERWRNVQELGRMLRDRFGGSATNFVAAADYDAPRLAQLAADTLTSFRDTSICQNREVRYFKRAQILAADLFGSFGGQGLGALRNIDQLTSFADYKLPQILRAWEILNYAPELARRVDRREPLPKDSLEENEIRSAMLWAVELLREALARHDRVLTSMQVDWFLWESSQHLRRNVKPYHRVRTIYY